MDNYLQLLERIAQAANLPREEVERKVEAKRAKLSGLVSKEGAAQIVAAELGIHFDKERMKIAQLVQGMKRANVVGKILEVMPVRSYSKNGKDGKVANLVIADDSGSTRAVLWDTNHIALVERGELQAGMTIEISNASVRNGEVHLSSFGDIKQSKEVLASVASVSTFSAGKLSDAKPGQSCKTRAFILQVFDPRYFEVCPECSKRVLEGECKVHGAVKGQRRALLNIILDDGSATMRSVLFGDQILSLGLDADTINSLEKFSEQKDALLGEEKVFSGTIRNNTLYNTTEFTINGVEDVLVEELLKQFESKA